jgi:gliding motility-associated-like protein
MKKMKNQILVKLTVLLFICVYANNNYAENKMPIKSFSYSLTTNPHDSLSVVAPNVFTPNGDGVNDTWSIIVHDYGITIFELQTTVYDRWGTQIFQTTNIREVWSGHNMIGKACDNGTYFFVVSYTNSSTGGQEITKGFIELLR